MYFRPTKTNQSRRASRLIAVVGVTLLTVLGATAAGASTLGPRKKAPALVNVSFSSGTSSQFFPLWVGITQGFFKKQGLNPTVTITSLTAAGQATALIAGTFQFENINPSAFILAVQQGAPIHAVAQTQTSTQQEIAISTTFAAAHNIPTTGNTAKGALAQFLALKGSHIVLGFSNTTAEGYNWIGTIASLHGMTFGLNCSTCDINAQSVGSVGSETAGLTAGKLDAFSNTPPTTVQPNTITIQLDKIPPASMTEGADLVTTTTMIQQSPRLVQGAVTAEMQAVQYIRAHPAQALRDVTTWFAMPTIGITSPEEIEYLFSGYLPLLKAPYYPTKAAYNIEVELVNGVQTPALTVPYSGFVDPKFSLAALNYLHLPAPKG